MSLAARQWDQWVMQTARHYGDISSIIHETGFENIDADHRKMIGQALEINRLMENLDHQNFNLELVYQLGELCNRLRQTTQEHFEREEELMERYKLSASKQHSEHHRQILKKLDDLIADLSEGKLTVTLHLKRAILDWVVVHINENDASTFQAQNLLPILESEEKPECLKDIFPSLGIPPLDEIHQQIHKTITHIEEDTCFVATKNFFSQACQLELHLSEHYPLELSEQHLKAHRHLERQFSKIEGVEGAEKHNELKKWRNHWFLHHHLHHKQELSVRNWGVAKFLEAQKGRELLKWIPDIDHEELDQGRLFSHNMLVKMVRQFKRLEADDTNLQAGDQLRKTIKKLRGHLRFQHEQEEELIKSKSQQNHDDHYAQHKHWIGLLDYLKVLVDSSQFEISHEVCQKLIADWVSHELFLNREIIAWPKSQPELTGGNTEGVTTASPNEESRC